MRPSNFRKTSSKEGKAPKCPGCGGRRFREEQTVYCSQWLGYNDLTDRFEYTSQTENWWDTLEAVGFQCDNCQTELPLHFLQEWVD